MPPTYPDDALVSSYLEDLLVNTYGMDRKDAPATAREVAAGRADHAKELIDEAFRAPVARLQLDAAHIKEYATIYSRKAAGEVVSPRDEEFLRQLADVHRLNVAEKQKYAKYDDAAFAALGAGVQGSSQAMSAADLEAERKGNRETFARDKKPGMHGAWLQRDNFQSLTPNPNYGKPEPSEENINGIGRDVLRALGYEPPRSVPGIPMLDRPIKMDVVYPDGIKAKTPDAIDPATYRHVLSNLGALK